MSNNEKYRQLRGEHSLTVQASAEMMAVSHQTARNWSKSPDSIGYRVMPDVALKCLVLVLEKSSLPTSGEE